MPTKQTGKALYKVREVESPIHHQFRGLRIEVAIPNMAGQKPFTSIPMPSFDKPYFVCRFGDYESWPVLTAKWPSIVEALRRMGFTDFQEIKAEQYRDDDRNHNTPTHDIAGIDTDEDA